MQGSFFRIEGADAETGEETSLILQAQDSEEAERIARDQGLLIALVRAATRDDWNPTPAKAHPPLAIVETITFEPRISSALTASDGSLSGVGPYPATSPNNLNSLTDASDALPPDAANRFSAAGHDIGGLITAGAAEAEPLAGETGEFALAEDGPIEADPSWEVFDEAPPAIVESSEISLDPPLLEDGPISTLPSIAEPEGQDDQANLDNDPIEPAAFLEPSPASILSATQNPVDLDVGELPFLSDSRPDLAIADAGSVPGESLEVVEESRPVAGNVPSVVNPDAFEPLLNESVVPTVHSAATSALDAGTDVVEGQINASPWSILDAPADNFEEVAPPPVAADALPDTVLVLHVPADPSLPATAIAVRKPHANADTPAARTAIKEKLAEAAAHASRSGVLAAGSSVVDSSQAHATQFVQAATPLAADDAAQANAPPDAAADDSVSIIAAHAAADDTVPISASSLDAAADERSPVRQLMHEISQLDSPLSNLLDDPIDQFTVPDAPAAQALPEQAVASHAAALALMDERGGSASLQPMVFSDLPMAADSSILSVDAPAEVPMPAAAQVKAPRPEPRRTPDASAAPLSPDAPSPDQPVAQTSHRPVPVNDKPAPAKSASAGAPRDARADTPRDGRATARRETPAAAVQETASATVRETTAAAARETPAAAVREGPASLARQTSAKSQREASLAAVAGSPVPPARASVPPRATVLPRPTAPAMSPRRPIRLTPSAVSRIPPPIPAAMAHPTTAAPAERAAHPVSEADADSLDLALTDAGSATPTALPDDGGNLGVQEPHGAHAIGLAGTPHSPQRRPARTPPRGLAGGATQRPVNHHGPSRWMTLLLLPVAITLVGGGITLIAMALLHPQTLNPTIVQSLELQLRLQRQIFLGAIAALAGLLVGVTVRLAHVSGKLSKVRSMHDRRA